jgi:hypothetical protein
MTISGFQSSVHSLRSKQIRYIILSNVCVHNSCKNNFFFLIICKNNKQVSANHRLVLHIFGNRKKLQTSLQVRRESRYALNLIDNFSPFVLVFLSKL